MASSTGGERTESTLTAGEVRYHAGGEHAVENLSGQPMQNAASRATCALTGAEAVFVAGGERTESTLTAGEVRYHAGGELAVENLSGAHGQAVRGFARSVDRQS